MNRPFLYIVFCVLLFALQYPAKAQLNLVPNGSFEEYDTCPTGVSVIGDYQLEHCNGWTHANNATPDYYNRCAVYDVSIPNSPLGYQQPKEGNAYMGLIAFPDTCWREYIKTKLLHPLLEGVEYYLEFYVNVSNSSRYGINTIGAFFSTTDLFQNNSSIINANPQIFNPSNRIINDTLNWVKISGTFIASGNECFLIIGNFCKDAAVDTLIANSNSNDVTYFFIDAVFLYEIESNINAPNVFTPNNDGINDLFVVKTKSLINYNIKIYNRWGSIVFETENPLNFWNGYSKNGIMSSEDVYFYIITAKGEEGKNYNLNGCVQLLR